MKKTKINSDAFAKRLGAGTIILFGILLIALFLRLNQLGNIPVGMTDDELREVFSAYAIWKTGHDLTRNLFFPFTFVVNDYSFSPIPIYVTAPFVGIFGLSVFAARLPFALAGFFVCVLSYLLTLRLLHKRSIALVSLLCMACNVWAIQLSRITHDAVFAQLFYLWGTYVFLSDWKKHTVRTIAISMTLFFLAFNSYDAMKVIYVPVICILLIYKWNDVWKQKKLFLPIIIGMMVTFGVFFYYFRFQNAGIHGPYMFVFQNTNAASNAVELARRSSSAPNFLKIMYHNKLTYFFDLFIHHFLYAFSPDFLFLSQEASGIFSLWGRGNFYLVELPLLILGALYVFTLKKPIFFLSLAAVLISALPSGVGPEPFTYATRSSFMIPWLSLWIGAGTVYAVEIVKKKFLKESIILLLIVMYTYSVGGYIQQYYFEWPKMGAEYFSKGIKDLVTYISPRKDQYDTFMISNINDTFVLHYAFYNTIDVRLLQQFYIENKNPLQFQSIRIIPSCLKTDGEDPRLFIDAKTMYITRRDCHKQTPDHIIFLPNNEPQWYIYIRPTAEIM